MKREEGIMKNERAGDVYGSEGGHGGSDFGIPLPGFFRALLRCRDDSGFCQLSVVLWRLCGNLGFGNGLRQVKII
jgi:hypothetical protein